MSNNVLFEIGVEEIPARFIDDAKNQLEQKTVKWLNDMHITWESIKTYSTPRRLAILIQHIAPYQTTVTEQVRGPQVKVAKDAEGNWTKAALGFVKGQGKQPEDIYEEDIKGTTYIFIEKKTEGKETKEILPEFQTIISDLHFPQTMRWGTGTYRFIRPIRWIMALRDADIIPFKVANVESSNKTYGHRFLGKEIELDDPLTYEKILEENFVIADSKKREKIIVEQIKAIEQAHGFHVVVDDALLNEVCNLIEYPTVFHGTFDDTYLQIPEEALITSMAEHQRYFPVRNKETKELLPYFVGVRNGDAVELDNVIRGNEKVLRARLADGAFFFEEDKKYSIDFYLNKLKTVVFQEKIGTIYEKLNHVTQIAEYVTTALQLEQTKKADALRAAEICKFDLMTEMVNEFPELQGIMGEKYALYYGEEETVAKAVREHYLPVQANGALPETTAGSVVSIADKLDTIVGSISVGLVPTGSQDPYGLRRQGIGILRILLDRKWDVSVESIIEYTSERYEITDENVKKEIASFFKHRAAFILAEEGIEQDVIQAVLDKGIGTFHYTAEKAKVLSAKRNDPAFKEVEESLVRIMNLDKEPAHTRVDTALFETESEKALHTMYEEINAGFTAFNKAFDATNALQQLEKLSQPIDDFFEHNMVMAEDKLVQQNRLALVHHISKMIKQFATLTRIEWKQHK